MNRARHIVSFRGRACTGGTSSLERHRLHRVYTGGTSSLERQRLHHACTRETSSLERHRLHHASTRGTSSLALGAIAASTGGTALGVPAVRRAIKPPPLGHNGDGGSSMPLLGHTDDGGLKTSKQRRTSWRRSNDRGECSRPTVRHLGEEREGGHSQNCTGK
jgi:hypothetical protein